MESHVPNVLLELSHRQGRQSVCNVHLEPSQAMIKHLVYVVHQVAFRWMEQVVISAPKIPIVLARARQFVSTVDQVPKYLTIL